MEVFKLIIMSFIRPNDIRGGAELMKDMVTYDIDMKLGFTYTFAYRLEIEDVNKLNLRRSPCQPPVGDFDASLHMQGLKTKCLNECLDEIANRIKCNCTQLNGYNSSLSLPDCEYLFIDLEMENLG